MNEKYLDENDDVPGSSGTGAVRWAAIVVMGILVWLAYEGWQLPDPPFPG